MIKMCKKSKTIKTIKKSKTIKTIFFKRIRLLIRIERVSRPPNKSFSTKIFKKVIHKNLTDIVLVN